MFRACNDCKKRHLRQMKRAIFLAVALAAATKLEGGVTHVGDPDDPPQHVVDAIEEVKPGVYIHVWDTLEHLEGSDLEHKMQQARAELKQSDEQMRQAQLEWAQRQAKI